MAKTTLAQWDPAANNNTDINGIAILGSDNVQNFDDALREMMAQLAASGIAPAFATRAAMAAMPSAAVVAGKFYFLSEAGREGLFKVVAGDASALVALDTQQGTIIAHSVLPSTAFTFQRVDLSNLTSTMFGGTAADTSTALNGFKTYVGNQTGAVKRDRVIIPNGDWKMPAMVESITQGLWLEGRGQSILRWDGAAGGYMFRVRDSSKAQFHNLVMLGKSGARPAAFIFLDDQDQVLGTAIGTGEYTQIESFIMGRQWNANVGGFDLGADRGIFIGGPNAANNDQFYIRNGQVFDCPTVGIDIANIQSIGGRLENIQFDTCGIGFRSQANVAVENCVFNRNTVCDIVVFNDISTSFRNVGAENSVRVIDAQLSASISLDGFTCSIRGIADAGSPRLTDKYYMQFASNRVYLNNVRATLITPTTECLKFTSTTQDRTFITIRDSFLPNGKTRIGYEVNAPGATQGVDFDIDTMGFKAKGRLDASVSYDPSAGAGTVANGNAFGTAQVAQSIHANAGITAGSCVLTSFGAYGNTMQRFGGCYANNVVYQRWVNRTGAAQTITTGKARWRNVINAELSARKIKNYDPPNILAGGFDVSTLPMACKLGDLTHWGCTGDLRLLGLTTYVQSNGVFAWLLNNPGATPLNFGAFDFYAYVIRDDAVDFIGSDFFTGFTINNGVTQVLAVPVPGIEIGDLAMGSINVDLQGVTLTAEITGSGAAQLVLYNGTGANVTFAAFTGKVGAFIALA